MVAKGMVKSLYLIFYFSVGIAHAEPSLEDVVADAEYCVLRIFDAEGDISLSEASLSCDRRSTSIDIVEGDIDRTIPSWPIVSKTRLVDKVIEAAKGALKTVGQCQTEIDSMTPRSECSFERRKPIGACLIKGRNRAEYRPSIYSGSQLEENLIFQANFPIDEWKEDEGMFHAFLEIVESKGCEMKNAQCGIRNGFSMNHKDDIASDRVFISINGVSIHRVFNVDDADSKIDLLIKRGVCQSPD